MNRPAMCRSRQVGLIAAALLHAATASAAPRTVPRTIDRADALAEAQAHRTGGYRIELAGMDPERFVRVAQRIQRRFKEGARVDRDALVPWTEQRKVERWRVRVPADYDPRVPHGVVVYLGNGADGKLPVEAWAGVLDRRRLIWIAPERVGEMIRPHWRIAKAIGAIALIRQRYTVNKDRRYVAGFSTGGQIAGALAISLPDFFSGAAYLCGCDPLKRSQRADDRFTAKARGNRYVLLTGEEDHARPVTQRVFKEYRKARFPAVEYLEVPGHGHAPPPAEWLDRALAALDAPLAPAAKRAHQQARRHDQAGRLGRGHRPLRRGPASRLRRRVRPRRQAALPIPPQGLRGGAAA